MNSNIPNKYLALLILGMSMARPAALLYGQDTLTKWVSSNGSTVEAEFVRLTDDGVVLRVKATGKETEVARSLLSLESQLQALKLGKPEEFSKPLAKAESPSTSITLTTLDMEQVANSPFDSNGSIEEFLATVMREIQEDNSLVFWHALTPSMQNDAEDLIVEAMAKLAGFRVQFKTLLGHANQITQNKKEYVLAHPMVASQPPVQEMVEQAWPALANLVAALDDDSLWEKDNFEKGNVVPWMFKFGARVGPAMQEFGEVTEKMVPPQMRQPGQISSSELKSVKYQIESQSSDSAVVSVTAGERELFKGKIIRTQGRWLPEEMVKTWPQSIRTAKQAIQQMDSGTLMPAQFMFAGVVAIVGRLAEADSQQSFNEAINELTALAGQNGGPGGPPANGPGAPSGSSRPGSARPGNPF